MNPENQGRECESWPESKGTGPRGPNGQGRGKVAVPAQADRAKSPLSTFLFYPALSRLGDAHWHRYGHLGTFFTPSADSDANLSQKHPPRHTQRSRSPVTWASLAQTSWLVNNHSSYVIQNRMQIYMQKICKNLLQVECKCFMQNKNVITTDWN